ncbi:MAG: NitT/TauT family transport system permease protein [Thermomicrobiales bacterium]|jgi:ABC-type nitrate/sulfonate/bicarbonate transport system permease component|nr:NitT/TauT family transport system permease protein [Thermomicrobiales bacterium]
MAHLMAAGSEQPSLGATTASVPRRRRIPRPNGWQILGIVLMLVSWELYAWHVHDQNPRRGDTMFPRFEFIATKSYPEFATFYGIEKGMLGRRSNYRQATIVLVKNSFVTAKRVLIGAGLGIGLGVAIGLMVGWSRRAREIVLPPILLLRTIPILALIPLFMFWFGAREIGILIYITFAVFAMMIINTLEAIRNVSPLYQDYARCMGASRFQVYRTVVTPAIVPALAGGIRVILGISWAIALAGELLSTDRGLGWLMILSERQLKTGSMAVVVALFVLFSLIVNAVFVRVSTYLSRWQPRADLT